MSIATVSRALNHTATVAPHTLERIKRTVQALNYVPNGAAKQLAKGRSAVFGFAIPHMRDDFFLPLLAGVERGAHEEGYELLIHTVPPRRGGDTPPLCSPLNEHNTAGLIVFPGSLSDADMRRLGALGFPLVALYQPLLQEARATTVTFENRRSAYELVRHLITQHDRRHIAYLRGTEQQRDSLEREEGYCDALREVGLEPLIGQGDYHEARARETVLAWLADGIPLDAIFTGSDEAAIGTLEALREGSVRVPEEMAVVGFDDLRVVRHLSPPLTTVRVPVEAAGYLAASLLIRCIRGEVVSDTVLPTELVIRASCGC